MGDTMFEAVLRQALQLSEVDQLRLIVMLQASIHTDASQAIVRALADRKHEGGGKRARPRTERSMELNAIDPRVTTSSDLSPEWQQRLDNWIKDSSFNSDLP